MKKVATRTNGLYTRGSIYYVRKIIPAHLRKIAGKREFLISLKTDKYEVAILKYHEAQECIEYTIKTMIDGTYVRDQSDFDHFSRLATSNGRKLECFTEILTDPVKASILANQLKQAKENNKLSKQLIHSYINIQDVEIKDAEIKDAGIKLSQLADIYIEAKKLELKSLNTREFSRKIDPLRNACKQLIGHLGNDNLVSKITKVEARSFYKALKERIYVENITANTANKYLIHLRVLLDTYHNENDLDVENVFKDLRFTDGKRKRSPLKIKFIKDQWLGLPPLGDPGLMLVHTWPDRYCRS